MRNDLSPLVSVVLPVYNGADYIAQAIESLLAQTIKCEIIVSDDCSTDDTVALVRSFNASNIVVRENKTNGGQYVNFNRAFRLASGDYVQLFSHDDVARPDFLKSQVEAFSQNPAIGLVYSSCRVIDEVGHVKYVGDDEGTPRIIDFDTYLQISSMFGCLPLSVSCVMLRREVFQTVGMFDERYSVSGDLEFCNRIAKRFLLARNRSLLLDVRAHAGSVTSGTRAPIRYMREEIGILPFYRLHLGDDGYRKMMARRTSQRGASHAKYILRSFFAGRLQDAAEAYRALAQVHNVPLCVLYAVKSVLVAAIARVRELSNRSVTCR